MDIRLAFDSVLQDLLQKCIVYYGEKLISLAIFGSVGRGTMKCNSDIDILIVAEPMPDGRLERKAEFSVVEQELMCRIKAMRKEGINTCLAPIFKTPKEVCLHFPLMLDMTEDAKILYDKNNFLHSELMKLKNRLQELGAKRIWRNEHWWWDLKPDYKEGEVFTI